MKIQMMPMLGNGKTKKLVIRTRTIPETIWEKPSSSQDSNIK